MGPAIPKLLIFRVASKFVRRVFCEFGFSSGPNSIFPAALLLSRFAGGLCGPGSIDWITTDNDDCLE